MSITMYYDETCILCTTNAEVMQAKNPSQINIMPVSQAEAILAKAGISLVDAMTYVVVEDEQGNMHKGMDAVRLLYKTANVPFNFVLGLPIIKQLGDFAYPYIARNRYYFPKWAIKLMYGKLADMNTCKNGVCHIPPAKR
ncbi:MULTISPECIES: thiol-disulfide oxidoreductase DCC family protein [unclassified Moraxella]|uniref:thiol-disulfide oxidoreductase DCC family protein n=1 Tax=unclassified Moraxella TaxID=2685852 RepID=UPI003AF93C15